ncbi:MAG: hypothetical protein LJE70_17245 [Chromatiaceae bacterium]|nr:hypothetical protein [Chromatiaceae bacterium]
MEMHWLYEWPLWLDGVLFWLLLLIAVEGGFWMGLRRHRRSVDAKSTVRGDVTLGSMLALLGLLLAFTYAFGLGRADMRKQAIVNEANAIGTAFLRADLGVEPGRSELRQGLLDYARTRLVYKDLFGEAQREAVDRSLEAQSRLWPAAERAVQGDVPGPIQAFILQAVNEVLDTNTVRLAVINDRIPGTVFGVLLLVAAVSLGVAAHNIGLNGTINRWRMSAFSLILAALMLVILDFDRGQHGFIRVSLQPLELVIKDLESQLEFR